MEFAIAIIFLGLAFMEVPQRKVEKELVNDTDDTVRDDSGDNREQ